MRCVYLENRAEFEFARDLQLREETRKKKSLQKALSEELKNVEESIKCQVEKSTEQMKTLAGLRLCELTSRRRLEWELCSKQSRIVA